MPGRDGRTRWSPDESPGEGSDVAHIHWTGGWVAGWGGAARGRLWDANRAGGRAGEAGRAESGWRRRGGERAGGGRGEPGGAGAPAARSRVVRRGGGVDGADHRREQARR